MNKNDYWVKRPAICNICGNKFIHISVNYKYCDQRFPKIKDNELFIKCENCKHASQLETIKFAMESSRILYKSFIKQLNKDKAINNFTSENNNAAP